jgi:UDP-N-acetylmuramoyl-L-alanyl-D-glutamate--2,6-diaminopimelate ligase
MEVKMKVKKLIDSNLILINHSVSKIVDNADEAVFNSIFVAIKGYKFNGIDFIEKAIENGAKTIIYDQELSLNLLDKNINFIKVIDSKVELARLLKKFYSKCKLPKIVAVTGTNGKTSTWTPIFASDLKQPSNFFYENNKLPNFLCELVNDEILEFID